MLATKVDEILTLVHGNFLVKDYTRKFDQLAKFANEVVPTKAIRVERFMRGLKPTIARDV